MKIIEVLNTRPEKFYHVTLLSNVKSIMKQGLIPQRGERSAQLNDRGIFLFSSRDDMENALMNWLGQEYEDLDVDLASLEITLPKDFPISPTPGAEYEWVTQTPIPPEYISFLQVE